MNNNNGTPPDPAQMIANRVQMLTRRLNLTSDQQAQATSIFTNAATAAQSIESNLQTARQSLQAAIKKNDTATIDSVSGQLGTVHGQLTAINAKADAALYAILTADQQAEYDQMPHGPGGPGGMGIGRFGPPPPRQ